MSTPAVQIALGLVVIHASVHLRHEVRASWRWLKRALDIKQFGQVSLPRKLLIAFLMLAMGCVAAGPVLYYSFEWYVRGYSAEPPAGPPLTEQMAQNPQRAADIKS